MGSYFHVIERKVGGNLDAFRRELGRLRESGHFHRDRHGERQVNDVGKCPVGKLGTELLHDQDLTVHPVVQLEAVVEHAVRSPVNLRRGDAVLSGLHALGGDVLLVVEIERLVGVQERMDDRQPLGAVHQVGLGPHGV